MACPTLAVFAAAQTGDKIVNTFYLSLFRDERLAARRTGQCIEYRAEHFAVDLFFIGQPVIAEPVRNRCDEAVLDHVECHIFDRVGYPIPGKRPACEDHFYHFGDIYLVEQFE